MPCWFTVKFLWDIQFLDNSVSQKVREYKSSCSRDIQVRHKSILYSNTKLFVRKSTVCHLSLQSISVTITEEENNCKECSAHHNSLLHDQVACIYFVDCRLQKCR